MVKKRVLSPIPVLDEALLSEALREEGIKEVSVAVGLLVLARLLMRRSHPVTSTLECPLR